VSAGLETFICRDWPERPHAIEVRPLAPRERCEARRRMLSALLPGERLVVPSGRAARRGNGQDVRFRAASDYVYLTGEGSPGGVLVLTPAGDGHVATVYLEPPFGRDDLRFFNDYHRGDFWVGGRPSLDEVEEALGVVARPLDELRNDLQADVKTRVVRGIDADLDALVAAADNPYPDRELLAVLSELRLVKDVWEVEQIEAAVAATVRGFEDVARALPGCVGERGERLAEVAFLARARRDGNDSAFNPIAAAGPHATTLHWTRNDGPLLNGDLLLLDAGVESETLYAADLTRTYPVSGMFSAVQRRMLELVNAAHDAALAAVAPGRPFRDFHRAVAAVMADGLAEWGLVPPDAEEDDLHRRFTICGPGHMLGLDVHDCANARAARYLDGVLEPGNVLTVEPGLYFQADDLLLPEELRGIGVRVEDDVVVTETGCRNLSEELPRRADDVEEWLAKLQTE
jgi:Xaa-Pro aminopeptidase